MTAIGSVFLGDVQRQRILSTSTPPSSPPPHLSTTSIDDLIDAAEKREQLTIPNGPAGESPRSIPPALSLDLRVRWLETLLYGTKTDAKDKAIKSIHGETLLRGVEELQRRLNTIVQGNEGLRRFTENYEQHAHLLTPSFALSGTIPTAAPAYENMNGSELEAFIAEMETDIRGADRDLREIEMLEKKNVTGAGKLAEYEQLQPRLEKLVEEHRKDLELAKSLEGRIAQLMDRYATNVDTLSELFVAWDEGIQDAEDELSRLERDKEERIRLGYQ
ncbi:hypothetical protein C8Q75DRAFT_723130 [Abortiporus biennis]|nr:hypothetical protein C8Q75DRAFT_723130 [Abortiporus biennis]